MISMYKWQQVRVLRQKGETIKGIARQLKLSRNTVRKYLRKDEPPQFKARQYERLLDPYEEVIKEMLKRASLARGYTMSSRNRATEALFPLCIVICQG
ncbi:hypothetical protein JZK55_11960 [Dissulfurispira thermophila]|uniref:HTH IS21-type domain-containing protein n=2 Tax=Dissulfurispira thermophila TaxID=2715679 RepID=A0A7G1H0M1_9BACT|nr:hypothetical protein JZK55_11960 [Dissulfurispira thermophila]